MSVTETPVVFTTGGTVQAGGGTYLPRRADADLLALCRQSQFAYVLTARQMGKSSLMVRTVERLSEENIRAVMIDLTQIGTQVTPEQWYLGLLAIIEEQLQLNADAVAWWQANAHLGFTQRLTNFFQEVLLKEIAEPVVIFVDEIDTTLSLDFTDDFYAAIRYLYNARATTPDFKRLSFVLIGVATPGDLIRDRQRTPFNIGQRVDLTDFTFEEVLPLAAGLNLPPDEAQQASSWVFKWTNGHPYLTQRLFLVLAEQGQSLWTESDVDNVVAATFFGEMSERDNNLQFVRDMLLERAPNVEGVLTTYQDVISGKGPVPDEEQSIVKSHLKLSGVLKRAGGKLLMRNRIYEKVFNEHWVRDNLRKSWRNLDPLAEDLFQIAQRFYSREQIADAETLLRQALQVSSSHLKSYLLLGRVLRESNRAVESVVVLEEAYKHNEAAVRGELIESLLVIVDSQDEAGQLAIYERILVVDPNQQVACDRRHAILVERAMKKATQYENEEDWEAAVGEYEALLQEYSSESEIHVRLERARVQASLARHYNEALGAIKIGNMDVALDLLFKVVSQQPNYKETPRYLLRAITGTDIEELKKDLEVSERSLALEQEQVRLLKAEAGKARKALVVAQETIGALEAELGILRKDLAAEREQLKTFERERAKMFLGLEQEKIKQLGIFSEGARKKSPMAPETIKWLKVLETEVGRRKVINQMHEPLGLLKLEIREVMEDFASSADPESQLKCPICNVEIQAKNLVHHFDNTH